MHIESGAWVARAWTVARPSPDKRLFIRLICVFLCAQKTTYLYLIQLSKLWVKTFLMLKVTKGI